jgi:hypothetical protein
MKTAPCSQVHHGFPPASAAQDHCSMAAGPGGACARACTKTSRPATKVTLIAGTVFWREQGDAGDYAAAGISSTSMSMSEYQHLNMAPNSPVERLHARL